MATISKIAGQNTGTLIHITDSIQSVIALRAFDCHHIEAAHQRVEEMRTAPSLYLGAPTLLDRGSRRGSPARS